MGRVPKTRSEEFLQWRNESKENTKRSWEIVRKSLGWWIQLENREWL